MSIPAKPHPNPLLSSRTLVIGGTSGLGAAVVSAALTNGGSVHISSSNPSKISSKLSEFRALYPGISATITGSPADLSDESTLEANLERVLDEATKALGGPLDHIIYTAGDAYEGKPLSSLDPKTYFKGWNVRYLGPLVIAKILGGKPGTFLKVAASSSITLTSGALAHKPIPGVAHFIGWAGAVEALTKGLALDLAPVRVNVVAPGAIYTEMLASLGEEGVKALGERTLTKRVGTVDECAEGYLFCMRSAFLTGEIIKIDGGTLFA